MKKFIPFESGALETVETVMVRDPLILSPLMRAREALARLRQVGVPRDFMANCYVADEGGRRPSWTGPAVWSCRWWTERAGWWGS